MNAANSAPTRFIGMDIHKHYFAAVGVDADQNVVFGPHQGTIQSLETWAEKNLTLNDAVVIEMTTNTYAVHDALKPFVGSVTVVHPLYVALIVRAQVKTDRKAALTLAQLHAAGLLPGIWVPPVEVRELRVLVAQRNKMVRLSSIAKCRLHSLLHRKRVKAPEGIEIFSPECQDWWDELELSSLERACLLSDLNTLRFARGEIERLEACMKEQAGKDERTPLLIQISGIGYLTALTILAAIGDISRFPSAKQLVGYAGLGARVHDSGVSHTTGRITKTGRRDLRRAMVDSANHAVRHHPHWIEDFEKRQPHLGRSKTVVAVARKLLVAVWYVLTNEQADKFADPTQVACSLFLLAHKIHVSNLQDGQSALQFTRNQLDRLGIGQEVTTIPWGSRRFNLPPSKVTCS
jgi:transposase